MRSLILCAAVAAASMPVAAHAQMAGDDAAATEISGKVAEKLSDPATQKALAQSVRVMGEILLDMPLAPLANAAAQMAGEEAADVDPDATLRKLGGPAASDVPAQIEENLPQMMGTAAVMAEGLGTMLPMLRQMAEQMQEKAQVLTRESMENAPDTGD